MKLAIFVAVIAFIIVTAVGFYVTDFTAYLGNNPTTCNNCHVMDAVYEGWFHGAHKNWALCNDCHTPHAFLPKYAVKALSGYHHVTAFFFKEIPVAIRAKPSSKKVVQENCIRCHADTIENIDFNPMSDGSQRYCVDCHRSTAHGERGISLLPYQHSEEYTK